MDSNFDDIFGSAIDQTMKEWKSFQLSVEHGMGGQYSLEKLVWMTQTIVQFFKLNKDLHIEEVIDFVTQIIDNEFSTIIEDGSLEMFAKNVCKYYELCASGQHKQVIQEIETMKRRNNSLEQNNDLIVENQMKELKISTESDLKEMNSTDNRDHENDGWTLIQRKNKK